MRHLISIAELDRIDVDTIFGVTQDIKDRFEQGIREPRLAGKVLALLFEKQSLRTRVSFESGMAHLGGSSLMLGDDVGFGKRESMADFAQVLSSMVDAIVVRAKQHQTVEELAKYSTCPVINGLTDQAHPCQALADLYTIREQFGDFSDCRFCWVGDGNNVAQSLAELCAVLGVPMAVATPQGYELPQDFCSELENRFPDWKLDQTHDAHQAAQGANVVYTDVWTSMGQEAERAKRLHDFADFQVNAALMKEARKDTIFMHCLPARRGEEVTDEVMDAPNSVVIQQATNRLHVQKGILVWLLAP